MGDTGNVFDQINDLNKEYDLGVKVVAFKEIITELMVIPEDMQPVEEDEEMEAAEVQAEAQEETAAQSQEEAGEVQGS